MRFYVLLALLLLSSVCWGQEPKGVGAASTFAVKGSRDAVAPWINTKGSKRIFFYRIHNRGVQPVEVMTKAESAKDKGKVIVRLDPDETTDLLLKGDEYILRCPLGGDSNGWYSLLKIFDPPPEEKKEEAKADEEKGEKS